MTRISAIFKNLGGYAGGFLILIVMILFSAVSYFVGLFTSSFDLNQCYGEIIHQIASVEEKEHKSAQQIIPTLPLAGYETSCSDVLNVLKKRDGDALAK